MIQNLKRVINNRIVAILLPGPSIGHLEWRIKELRGLDICYASVNDFWIMEQRILHKIGQRLDMVMCSAKECGVPAKSHNGYLRRKDDNLFITETKSFHHSLDEYKSRFSEKLVFFETSLLQDWLRYPDKEHLLHFFAQASFVILISLALIGGAKTIVLFGADGGDRSGKRLYYGGWDSVSAVRLAYDTGVVNMTMLQVLQNVCRVHDISPARIINCSPDTYYTPFHIRNYDTTVEFLKENAKGVL